MPRSRSTAAAAAACAFFAAVAGVALTDVGETVVSQGADLVAPADDVAAPGPVVTLAFAGDVHFAGRLSTVPDRTDSTLGPMSAELAAADLAMVNLETSITDAGRRTGKELEDPGNRYWFKTDAAALDVLDRSGVDVVSVANNHGADYGAAGLADTLQAADAGGPVAIVGAGRDDREAYAPFRTRVKGVDVAVLAGDASPRESARSIWSARPGTGPGLASARDDQAARLATAVREAQAVDDLVVVYLHWGEEGSRCTTAPQRDLAQLLTDAGADVIVGAHAHRPQGAGTNGSAYVSYGLGNFHWYHGREADTGVLNLSVRDGEVVGDEWVPARFRPAGGGPRPLSGEAADDAVEEWGELRDCTDLDAGPGPLPDSPPTDDTPDTTDLPAFAADVSRIDASVEASMTSHDPGRCPVPLSRLRHVELSHIGFDGREHRGELVVDAAVADDVVAVFETLYEERFPIRRMRLVDEYGGDDDRSMAANNTSAYNCRRVAGTDRWSNHAYGRAIDINPVQNPYVVGGDVRPPAAEEFLDVDRDGGADVPAGVITANGVVRRQFDRIGWVWGGLFAEPDYQHFAIG